MQYAIANTDRIEATPGARALCPACGDTVIAKCGDIKQWHWAHLQNDCDLWSEGMTQWHWEWQSYFPAKWREVVITKGGAFHRADIRLPNGLVIEFQHSFLSAREIEERERFYGQMLWVFDAREAMEDNRIDFRDKGTHFTFRWKHARLSIAYAYYVKHLDVGRDWLFEIRKISKAAPCGGWGYAVSKAYFLRSILPTLGDGITEPALPFRIEAQQRRIQRLREMTNTVTLEGVYE